MWNTYPITILIVRTAGFIGANFVLDWLAKSNEAVLNFDKRNYAGILEILTNLQGNGRHVFVQGDIGDAELVARLRHKVTNIGCR